MATVRRQRPTAQAKVTSEEEKEWLAFQSKLDSLKENQPIYQQKIYPYNPNFITDYKGYKYGMTVAQLERLFAFRKQNKYVNSAKEFQEVSKVSDSLLKEIKAARKLFPKAKIVGHRDLSPDLNGDGIIQPNEWTKLCPSFPAITEYKNL